VSAKSLIRQEQLRLRADYRILLHYHMHNPILDPPPAEFHEEYLLGDFRIHCPFGEVWFTSNPPEVPFSSVLGWELYAYAFEDDTSPLPGGYGHDWHDEAISSTYPFPTTSMTVTGTVDIVIDVDVVYLREALPGALLANDPDDPSDPPRKLVWPAYGDRGLGVWEPDYPEAASHRAVRVTRPGGTITTTITGTDGAHATSASMSVTITDRVELGALEMTLTGASRCSSVSGLVQMLEVSERALEHGGVVDGSAAPWVPFDTPSVSYSRSVGSSSVTMTGSDVDVICDDAAAEVSFGQQITPDRTLACVGALRRHGEAMGGTWDIHAVKRAGHGTETISAGSTWDGGVTQVGGHSCSCTIGGAVQTSEITPSEYTPVRYWISDASLTANGDDDWAWRVLIHTLPFDAMSIEQAQSLTIDDGSSLGPTLDHYAGSWSSSAATLSVSGGIRAAMGGAAGSVTRAFAPLRAGLSGYRYLEVRASVVSGTGTFQVVIGSKTWDRDYAGASLVATVAPQTFLIDLCAPTNMTGVTDVMDTRFGPDLALADEGWVMPTHDDSVADPGCMWGVQGATSIRFELQASVTYTFVSLALRRLIAPGDDAKGESFSLLGLAPAWRKWTLFSDDTVHGAGDTRTRTYIQTHAVGNTDGRYSLEECCGEIVVVDPPSGVRSTTYVGLTIADVLDKINADTESWPVEGVTTYDRRLRNAGWVAAYAGGADTAEGADYSSWLNGDMNKHRPAVWLGGAGGVYAEMATGTQPVWTWMIDNPRRAGTSDVTYPVRAQALCDQFDWDAGLGDVFRLSATPGELDAETTIAAAAILRGRAWGLVLLTDVTPAEAVEVRVARDGGLYGTAMTDVQGQYRTGIPYGRGDREHTVQLNDGASPALSLGAMFRDRWSARRCFRSGLSATEWISYDVSDSGRHYRAYVDGAELVIGNAADVDAMVWEDRHTGVTAKRPCVRCGRMDRRQRVHVVYEATSGGPVVERTTLDEGRSWSAVETIFAAGKFGTMAQCRDGRRYLFAVNAGAIIAQCRDPYDAVMIPTGTVVASGVDDDAIAASEFMRGQGVWSLKLTYRSGGAIVDVVSTDGITFA
jgi:hypothetical protein